MWSASESSDDDVHFKEKSDDEILLALAAYVANEEGSKTERKARKVPVMTGIQWVELKLQDPKDFYDMFRMRRTVFHRLHDTLVNSYGLTPTPYMCTKEALALFLWTLGSPQSNANCADRFEHSASTISTKFTEVLYCVDRMAADYIKPRDPTFTVVHPTLRKPRFWPHFQNAIGAIDGTHIPVTVPANQKVMHMNRHGYTSENVMAVCDFDMRFTFVVTGWPGSVHDTRVWSDALVAYENYPHPPAGNLLIYAFISITYALFITACDVHFSLIIGKYYLVDSGYPNRVGYLAPYKGQRYHVPEFQQTAPVGEKEIFNHRHSSLRNVIERSFGVLKMKWRILRGIPSYPMDKQKMIISACMCLHNYIRESALRDEHFDIFERGEYVQEDMPPPLGEYNNAPIDDGTMGQTRDAIAASLVG